MSGEPSLRFPITRDLGLLRDVLTRRAAAAGLTGARLDDLVLAVNEAADNVLDHGGGTGTLVIGSDEHGVCVEVIDPAGTLTAAHLFMHGASPPPVATRGYGLWLIRQLCDETVLDHPGGCSRLRLHMRYRTAGREHRVSGDPASERPERAPRTVGTGRPAGVTISRRASGPCTPISRSPPPRASARRWQAISVQSPWESQKRSPEVSTTILGVSPSNRSRARTSGRRLP
nr:ATP-binding protein [Nonomuraea antri]